MPGEDAFNGVVGACHGTFDRLASLADNTVERVFPGHGPVFDDLEGAVEGAVYSLDSLLDGVQGEVSDLEQPSALDVTFARKKPDQDVGYLIFDTAGALGYLDEQGRVESWTEDGVRRFEASEA